MTRYIIYHKTNRDTDCPDGIHSAAIAKLKYPYAIILGDSYKDNSEYGNFPFGLPVFKEGDELTIVDFCYPYEWLKYWENIGVKVTIIDHHAPKFGMLKNFKNAVLDASECGATLTWKYLFPEAEVPEILEYVASRDIGRNGYYESEGSDWEIVAEGLSQLRYKADDKIKFLQDILFDVEAIAKCRQEGAEPVRVKYKTAYKAVSRSRYANLRLPLTTIKDLWRWIWGYRVPYVKLKPHEDRYVSAISNILAKKVPRSFAWVETSNGGSRLTSKRFDVSKIAEKLGGDGHYQVAGFKRKKRQRS